MFKPYPHQQQIIDLKRNRLGLWCECGTGKTATALWALEELGRKNVLIVVPLTVFGKWLKDIEALYLNPDDQITHVKNRYSTLIYPDKSYHVMTKEFFKLKFHYSSPEARSIDGLIVDEGHFFGGIKSQLSKKLYTFIQQFPADDLSVYILTATPYLSTPWNVYTLGKHLGAPYEYHKFRREMFFPMKMGRRTIWEPRRNSNDLLQPYINELGVFVRVEDVIDDLPAQSILEVSLDLSSDQQKAIASIQESEAIQRFTKQHQIEAGYIPAIPLLDQPHIELPNAKIDYIIDYVKQHPKTAIVCRYTKQLQIIERALHARSLSTSILDGSTKSRDTVIDHARNSTAHILLIQASVSEGYDLPEYEHVIFASLDWSYKNYIQMRGRFLRINAPTPTDFTILIGGDVDRRVLQAIKRKEDFYV